LALIPPFFEQFVEIKRQLAWQQPAISPQSEKQLADLNASISEWSDWRQRQPGPGTLTVLRANAKWLVPLFATVANPTLLVQPWLISLLGANGTAQAGDDIYSRWRTWITVNNILKDRGVKRRG
jgi:hypothetical protein